MSRTVVVIPDIEHAKDWKQMTVTKVPKDTLVTVEHGKPATKTILVDFTAGENKREREIGCCFFRCLAGVAIFGRETGKNKTALEKTKTHLEPKPHQNKHQNNNPNQQTQQQPQQTGGKLPEPRPHVKKNGTQLLFEIPKAQRGLEFTLPEKTTKVFEMDGYDPQIVVVALNTTAFTALHGDKDEKYK